MPSAPCDPRNDIVLTTVDGASGNQILRQLAAAGYGEVLRPAPPPASLRCGACGSVSAVTTFANVWAQRLARISEPEGTVLVFAAQCPVCSHGGSVVLEIGPDSSPEDAALVAEIPHSVHFAGPTATGARNRTPRSMGFQADCTGGCDGPIIRRGAR